MHRAQPVASNRNSNILRALILGGYVLAALAGCAHRAGTGTGAASHAAALNVDPYISLLPEERITVYQESLQVKPDNAIIHFRLGNAYYDLKQVSRAVEEYQAAVKLDSTLAPAWGNLGTAFQEQDDLTGALNAYQKAVGLTPNDAAAWSNLGSVAYAKGQHQVAESCYVKALKLDPKNVQALYNLGVAFADARIYPEAIRKWQAVLELEPGSEAGKNAQTNITLLQSLRSAEENRKAQEERAMQKAPGTAPSPGAPGGAPPAPAPGGGAPHAPH